MASIDGASSQCWHVSSGAGMPHLGVIGPGICGELHCLYAPIGAQAAQAGARVPHIGHVNIAVVHHGHAGCGPAV